jgi:hypothetical protein
VLCDKKRRRDHPPFSNHDSHSGSCSGSIARTKHARMKKGREDSSRNLSGRKLNSRLKEAYDDRARSQKKQNGRDHQHSVVHGDKIKSSRMKAGGRARSTDGRIKKHRHSSSGVDKIKSSSKKSGGLSRNVRVNVSSRGHTDSWNSGIHGSKTKLLDTDKVFGEMLRKLKRTHGSVLQLMADEELLNWVQCQRRQCRRMLDREGGPMTQDRVEQLESIGFAWEEGSAQASDSVKKRDKKKPCTAKEKRKSGAKGKIMAYKNAQQVKVKVGRNLKEVWEGHFEDYKAHIFRYKTFQVAGAIDKVLSRWVDKQRYCYRQLVSGANTYCILPHRKKKLDDIEFPFDAVQTSVNDRVLNKISKSSKKKLPQNVITLEGDTLTPRSKGGGAADKYGAHNGVRAARKGSSAKCEFRYEPGRTVNDKAWNNHFSIYKLYIVHNKTFHVPLSVNAVLCQWVKRQIHTWRNLKNRAAENCFFNYRKELLDEIEFPWEARAQDKDVNESTLSKIKRSLYIKVDQAPSRKRYRNTPPQPPNNGPQARRAKLIYFEERVAALKEFKQEHGHLEVKSLHNPSLAKWVRDTRSFFRTTKKRNLPGFRGLTPEKIRALNEIGLFDDIIVEEGSLLCVAGNPNDSR